MASLVAAVAGVAETEAGVAEMEAGVAEMEAELASWSEGPRQLRGRCCGGAGLERAGETHNVS